MVFVNFRSQGVSKIMCTVECGMFNFQGVCLVEFLDSKQTKAISTSFDLGSVTRCVPGLFPS